MASGVKSTITGGQDIAKAFRQLTPGLTVPINEASRAAMKPMLAAAKSNAPVESGALKKSLIIKNRKGTTLVGPSKNYVGPNGKKAVKYAHLVEFGRAPNSEGHGELQGTRFMTRAFE